ncbi:hypothetical protein [Isoptericola sediminis]|uniref:Uncharacterized protein n=1 Tax=Isoptericola sediminis TaxID=2733572 RepID=A0A849K6Q8_9MICO|nr:hypothetical protein [Isoptericola sediminis]NNU28661.1 hypothetical protein [Isoptericola sediminis]
MLEDATAYVDKREAQGKAPTKLQEYRRYVQRFVENDPIGLGRDAQGAGEPVECRGEAEAGVVVPRGRV